MHYEEMRADWDRRAREDAFFYVAFAKRGQSRDEFLATARENIGVFESELSRLPRTDVAERRALEIGCGPGRLMLPMSEHFGEIHGVDISPAMVELARETLAGVPHAHVHVVDGSDLRLFASGSFHFVYSYAVFQHIPSKDAVLSYIAETGRVLTRGGIACLHVRGTPPVASQLVSESSTWIGCYFTFDEVRQFVTDNALQLVSVSGIGTQYMFLTLRRPDRDRVDQGGSPELLGISWAKGAGQTVPKAGRDAAVSLWFRSIPNDASLLDFDILFAGRSITPQFISSPEEAGVYQVNCRIPPGLAEGRIDVAVNFRRALIGKDEIILTEAASETPKIMSVSDAAELGSKSMRCDALSIIIEDVPVPVSAEFTVDGKQSGPFEFHCVDTICSKFQFAVKVPPLGPGAHQIAASFEGGKTAVVEFMVN